MNPRPVPGSRLSFDLPVRWRAARCGPGPVGQGAGPEVRKPDARARARTSGASDCRRRRSCRPPAHSGCSGPAGRHRASVRLRPADRHRGRNGADAETSERAEKGMATSGSFTKIRNASAPGDGRPRKISASQVPGSGREWRRQVEGSGQQDRTPHRRAGNNRHHIRPRGHSLLTGESITRMTHNRKLHFGAVAQPSREQSRGSRRDFTRHRQCRALRLELEDGRRGEEAVALADPGKGPAIDHALFLIGRYVDRRSSPGSGRGADRRGGRDGLDSIFHLSDNPLTG